MNEEFKENKKTEMSLMSANLGTFISAILIGILFSFVFGFISSAIMMGLGIAEDTYVFDALLHVNSYCVYLCLFIIFQVLLIFCTMHFAVRDQFRKKYLSEENFKRYRISTLTLIIIEVIFDTISYYSSFKPYLDVFKEYNPSDLSTTIFMIEFISFFIIIPVASYFIYKHVIKLAATRNSIE